MTLIRMFHYGCDSDRSRTIRRPYDCEDSTGDEWYASVARSRAIDQGWHLGAAYALCPVCWDAGIRPKHLTKYEF
jgi:hypothetical protein